MLSEDFPAQLAGIRAGSLLAGYRLETQVGTGGMAVVFRARDERLRRLVALKILAPALSADSAFRRRFIAESRAAAAVDDPHIIPVYEAGESDGVLFIAMRFIPGGDLRRVLEREGVLAPERAVEFISPVASALDAAHDAGLVHRDVKPANILVDVRPARSDHVYLSDFGVSKGAMTSVSMTGTGQFLGTPHYSAPEQIQGGTVDGRTDQYALACVAYQLLTGTVPFQRDQGMAVLLAHLSEPPPSLAARRPNLPAAADPVLARALEKTPEKRYRSCEGFAEALRDALGLALRHPRSATSAPDHPETVIASPLSKLPGPATAGTEKAAVPADPAATETMDLPPRRAPAGDLPAALPIVPDSAHPGAHPEPASESPASRSKPLHDLSVGTASSATADAVLPVTGAEPSSADSTAGQLDAELDGVPAIPLTDRGQRAAPPLGDDRIRAATGSLGLGQRAPRAHLSRRTILSRPRIVITTAVGIAVIGLVIAAVMISGSRGVSGSTGRVRWSYTVAGNVVSSPVVANGTVYIGSTDGNVYALDAATGSLRWSHIIAGNVVASPAVANGTVYIGSTDGNVYALDAATGSLRWSHAGNLSSPAVTGGTVYIGGVGEVYALDAATGHLRWSQTTNYYDSPGEDDSSPTVAGGTVYVSDSYADVYALDAATGNFLWSNDRIPNTDLSSPAVSGETVYVSDNEDNMYALNASTGSIRWSSVGSLSSTAVTGGTIYTIGDDGKVSALDAATGSLRWSHTIAGNVVSSPAVADGTIYTVGDNGKVSALDAATGSLHWSYTIAGNVVSNPTVADGTVYIGSEDHKMYALDAATGSLRWSYTTGSYLVSDPAVAVGTVYIGSGERVYALSAGP